MNGSNLQTRPDPAPLQAKGEGATARIAAPRLTEAAAAPTPPHLFTPDAWLTDEARELLARIVKAAPDRSKTIAVTGGGQTAALGYSGRNAELLRTIFNRHLARLFDWMNEERFGTPEQQDRRNRIIAYAKEHDADATIERALDAGWANAEKAALRRAA